MARYIISVHQIFPESDEKSTTASTQEVFKLGVDEFDPVAFTVALTKRPRKRRSTTAPTKSAS